MKRRNTGQVLGDYQRLKNAGYMVEKKEWYHWHVKKKDNWRVINVWPTVGKYMPLGASEANHYKDIVKTMNALFKEGEQRKNIDTEAKQNVHNLREGGLQYFTKKLKIANDQ